VYIFSKSNTPAPKKQDKERQHSATKITQFQALVQRLNNTDRKSMSDGSYSTRPQWGAIRLTDCRELFKDWKILTLLSQYIFSLLLFTVNNRDYFLSNSVYHNINTRRKNYLHSPQVSLGMNQKGIYYSGITIFNGVPNAIKDISSKPKKFKIALKHYLLTFILQFR